MPVKRRYVSSSSNVSADACKAGNAGRKGHKSRGKRQIVAHVR